MRDICLFTHHMFKLKGLLSHFSWLADTTILVTFGGGDCVGSSSGGAGDGGRAPIACMTVVIPIGHLFSSGLQENKYIYIYIYIYIYRIEAEQVKEEIKCVKLVVRKSSTYWLKGALTAATCQK